MVDDRITSNKLQVKFMVCFIPCIRLVSNLLGCQDEIRNKISTLETTLVNETHNSTSSFFWFEKYKQTRMDLEKKFDTQYQC